MRIRYNAAAAIALNSQRIQTSSMAKSLEKLSTGLRINRASDDAAGLSVSEKLRTQVRGSKQAIRNVQDATSLFQIEEGVLASMQSMLQRMRELSLQAMSDTLTDTERGLINIEVAALVDELGRLASQKPYLNSFQMDGTFAPYARTTSTGNEAIASEDSVIVTGATTIEDFFGTEFIVEVLQVAQSQELDDVSQTTTHIQETLGAGLVAFQNNYTISGTSSGNRGDDLITFTAGAEPLTAGNTGTLERQTDLTDIDPNYSIVGGGPIDAGDVFQLQVGSQDLLGTLYQITGEATTTNVAGLSGTLNTVNGTDVDNITRVQTDRYAIQSLADADDQVTMAGLAPTLDEVKVKIAGTWTTLNELGSTVNGENAYTIAGNTITVGVNNLGVLDTTGTFDISVRYTDAGQMHDILDVGDGGFTPGSMGYTFNPASNTITVGVDEDGVLDGVAIGANLTVDYQAVEDTYDFSYDTNRFFQLPGAGAATNGAGEIQFAEDLYDGAGNIGVDNDGNHKLEVRVNGVITTDYNYHDDYMGTKNVIEFGFTPLATDVITVDYTTATQTAVDWTAATLGENTTSDGNVTLNEALTKGGVFNDFWDGQTANTITVNQANRGTSMTLALDPNWTVTQFIDAFNAQAEINDVEAVAFFNVADNEVQIGPGTSGWKDRPITGWGGSYFDLSGPIINSSTVIGPGSTGDDSANQNAYQLNESQASTDSIIRLSTEDGTVLGVSTSSWNEHTFSDIGLTLKIQGTAEVGDTSQFLLSASELLAGPNGGFVDLVYFHIPDVSPDALGIDNINVNSRNSAFNAMTSIDSANDIITSRRVYFGTKIIQNNHIINNLSNNVINTQNSESLIRDADYALETTQFAKSQILLQASQAVLAQANSAQKNVLGLLNQLS